MRTGCNGGVAFRGAAANSTMEERSRDLNITAGDSCSSKGRRQALCCLILMTAGVASGQTKVHACAVLQSQKGHDDTSRIQSALNLCNPGKAVILRGGSF